MSKLSDRKVVSILQILQEYDKPIGSAIIALKLQVFGVDMSERTVRHYLQRMDQDSLTKNFGKRGRIITPKGVDELKSAFVFEKVGFVATKIDTLTYQMDFSLQKSMGSIILNLTTFDKQHLYKAFKQIESVFQAKLGMGRYMTIGYPGTVIGNIKIDADRVAIGTVCSVTINGILFKKGIYTTARFGGLLEISKGQPLRFIEIINYDGTSIDPLEIFIKGGMTSVKNVTLTGNGRIGASFREFPSIALNKVERIKKRMEEIGLGGILMIGRPGQPLLGIPVPEGRTGMIVSGGLNPIAAVEETGISTENAAMKLFFNFNKMVSYTEIKV